MTRYMKLSDEAAAWLEQIQRQAEYVTDCLQDAIQRVGARDGLGYLLRFVRTLGGASFVAAPTGEGEPGCPIGQADCPCCGAGLQIEHGDEPGDIGVVGAAQPTGEGELPDEVRRLREADPLWLERMCTALLRHHGEVIPRCVRWLATAPAAQIVAASESDAEVLREWQRHHSESAIRHHDGTMFSAVARARITTRDPGSTEAAKGEAARADWCWHCGVMLAPPYQRPRCEDCPDECDIEGCDEMGCRDSGSARAGEQPAADGLQSRESMPEPVASPAEPIAGEKPAAASLLDQLVRAAVFECDRAVEQAQRVWEGGERTASHGGTHDTCFRALFEPILARLPTIATSEQVCAAVRQWQSLEPEHGQRAAIESLRLDGHLSVNAGYPAIEVLRRIATATVLPVEPVVELLRAARPQYSLNFSDRIPPLDRAYNALPAEWKDLLKP